MPVTILIPAKNEERNLPECLQSVQWAEKIYVIDSNSNDGTSAICSDYGVELVQFNYNGGWPKKKNWALENLPISTPWTFILDADERVSDELRDEIKVAISDQSIDGYYIRWQFMFLGRWMKHSWSHGWMLRLFRTGAGKYEDLGMRGEGGWDNEVHENVVVDGKTTSLREYLIHDSRETLSHWIKKQNEFSDWNARRRINQVSNLRLKFSDLASQQPVVRRRALKALYLRLPLKPILMFLYLYFIKLGFLDRKEGFYFCVLRAVHEFNTDAKIFEIKKELGSTTNETDSAKS